MLTFLRRDRARLGTLATFALLVGATAVAATATEAPAESELDELARRIPFESDPEGESRTLLAVAVASELSEVEATIGTPAAGDLARRLEELGARTSIHELAARGAADTAVAWLDRLRRLPRPSVVERFELEAVSAGELRLTARLLFPTLDPYGAGLETSRALVALYDRPEPARALAALGRFAERLAAAPVALTRARFEYPDVLQLEAVALGASGVAELASAGGASGAGELVFDERAEGDCRFLVASGRLVADPENPPDETPALLELFQRPTDADCRAPATARPQRAERRGAPGREGTISVRARGASRSEALRIFGRLTGRPTIAASGEAATIDLDLVDLTADEALETLAAAGAPLHRFAETIVWGDSPLSREPDRPYQGEPVSFDFTCVGLDDLLALFGEISGLIFETPGPLGGCVDLHGRDRPWDETLDALLAAARLKHGIEGGTVRVSPAGSVDSSRTPTPERGLVGVRWFPPLQRLAIADLRLVGLVRTAEGWRALARAPVRRTIELAPGDELADGRVTTVDDAGVTFAGQTGETRLTLP